MCLQIGLHSVAKSMFSKASALREGGGTSPSRTHPLLVIHAHFKVHIYYFRTPHFPDLATGLVPGLGTRAGSTLLFSTTTRFCDIKQRRNCSFLTSSSITIASLTIRSSGVLLGTGRVFLMRFIVGVKSYIAKLL